MAFRAYELNLIMRVQDRGSTRLRRIARDLGGVNRAAQMQRNAGRLAESQQRNLNQQTKVSQQLASHTNKLGSDALSLQSRLNTMKAAEIGHAARLKKTGLDLNAIRKMGFRNDRAWAQLQGGQIITLSEKQTQIALKGLAIQKDMIRLRTTESAKVAELNAQLAGLVTEQAVLNAQAARLEEQYARIAALQAASGRARVATHVGGAAAFAGGIGLAVLGGAASTFAEFNRSTVKAATQMRGVNESFESTIGVAGRLQTGILDMTRDFPASASEMADSAFQIASGMDLMGGSVKRFGTTMRVLRTTNRVAVAGFTDLGSATDALITIINNFDPEIKHVNTRMNELFAIVRFGRGDFTQFSQLFGGVASAAKGAGQSLVEAGSALAFLTTRLPRAEAATSVRRLLQILALPTFQAGFKAIFGTPITVDVGGGVEKLLPLSEIINTIVSRAPELTRGGVALQNLIQEVTKRGQLELTGRQGQGIQGTEMAKRGLVQLITGWRQYRDVLANVTADTDEFDRSFEAASATPGVRWQIAINQFKAFGIIVGQEVLPVIVQLIDKMSDVAHWFEDLSPTTRHLIGTFAAWGSVLAFVGGIMLVFVGSIARMIIAFKLLEAAEESSLTKTALLRNALMALSAIAVISIGIKVFMTGDATGIDLISGALAGAGLGASIGMAGGPGGAAIGAGIGAISVPVVLHIIDEVRDDRGRAKAGLATAFGERQRQAFANQGGDMAQVTFEEFEKEWKQRSAALDLPVNVKRTTTKRGFSREATEALQAGKITQEQYIKGMELVGFNPTAIVAQMERFRHENSQITDKIFMRGWIPASKKTTQSVFEDWNNLTQQLTGVSAFGELTSQAAQAGAEMAAALSKAVALGDVGGITRAINASLALTRQRILELQASERTALVVKQLNELYQYQASLLEQLVKIGGLASPKLALATAKAEAIGSEAQIQAAAGAEINWTKSRIAAVEQLPKTKVNIEILTGLYRDLGALTGKLTKTTKDQVSAESGLAGERVRAAEQARKDRLEKIKQAADKLVDKFKELEDANKAAFQIFEGPISKGPIAGIFNQINETLSGFGAKPIAIPVSLQIQDITAQVRNFELFRKDLNALRRRGAPPELIDELQKKGVEALPLIEGLRKAGPGAFRSYVAMWERSQKLIKDTTNKDMTATLKLWNSYGSKIAWEIVQGLSSDKAQVLLRAGYSKWIVATFGKVLEKEMAEQIEQAVSVFSAKTEAKQKAKDSAKNSAKTGTRSTQSAGNTTVNNNNTTVHADGVTTHSMKRAFDQAAFARRYGK